MDKEIFAQFVNASRNDVYIWMKEVQKNTVLASDLLECHSKESVLLCLQEALHKHSLVDASKKGKVLKAVEHKSFSLATRESLDDILSHMKEVYLRV